MLNDMEKQAKQRMQTTIEALKVDLAKVRTGRAQVAMLDSVRVDYYGSLVPLNQVAALSCPDAKSFLIAPWETAVVKAIEAGIIKSDIGMTPQSDGKVIRLRLPDLTEERRKDLVKQIKKILEDARVAIRMVRRDCNEELKQAQKNKAISEDEQKRGQDLIQKLTDDFIEQIDKVGAEKEKDLMKV